MALSASTGLRNGVLATGALKTLLAGGFIKIYSGALPASADAAIGAGNTLLCTVSLNSTATGLTFDVAANGIIPKTAAETWSGVNVAAGAASFYRHVTPSDDGTNSTTQVRLQGAIATAGAELNLSSINLALSAVQTIDYYVVALPSL